MLCFISVTSLDNSSLDFWFFVTCASFPYTYILHILRERYVVHVLERSVSSLTSPEPEPKLANSALSSLPPANLRKEVCSRSRALFQEKKSAFLKALKSRNIFFVRRSKKKVGGREGGNALQFEILCNGGGFPPHAPSYVVLGGILLFSLI